MRQSPHLLLFMIAAMQPEYCSSAPQADQCDARQAPSTDSRNCLIGAAKKCWWKTWLPTFLPQTGYNEGITLGKSETRNALAQSKF